MQFLIDLSNTALELKKAGLQFLSDIFVSVHLSHCTVFCRCGSRRAVPGARWVWGDLFRNRATYLTLGQPSSF
jgi:hypothetical protein